ncbi:hypothetical protein TWF225_007103 [Orbilia oligospora]|nr:hypothetical protein TWF225_007103 [Orbilia oligospora]KAF3270066.1 hypothetical protein TWF217_008408 [Orbilia oligospora]KAF3270538.1 hypothetical protein TWF128_004297 [Orbilia oligospora]KAF3276480.1 hypothetical protein TWF132_002188 [Orbilia oligospora]
MNGILARYSNLSYQRRVHFIENSKLILASLALLGEMCPARSRGVVVKRKWEGATLLAISSITVQSYELLKLGRFIIWGRSRFPIDGEILSSAQAPVSADQCQLLRKVASESRLAALPEERRLLPIKSCRSAPRMVFHLTSAPASIFGIHTNQYVLPPKMFSFIREISSLVAVAALLVPTLAAPTVGALAAPPDVAIDKIIYGGTGCPRDSAYVNLASDKQSFTAYFSKFTASIEKDNIRNSRKFCQLSLAVDTPPSWQFTVVETTFTGFASLDPGVVATHISTAYFAGSTEEQSFSIPIRGPTNQYFTFRSTSVVGTGGWSPCGTQALLNIKSDLRLTGEGRGAITETSGKTAFRNISLEDGHSLISPSSPDHVINTDDGNYIASAIDLFRPPNVNIVTLRVLQALKMHTKRNTTRWDFDIDNYINPWIPPSILQELPTSISRFLGYRTSPRKELGSILVAWWSLFGAFCGIAAVSAVFKYSGVFSELDPPLIIGSFGASAILEYGVIGSPLGQPRNCVLGHFVSAICGVGVAKLFQLNSHFEEIKWLAGAVSVGLASAVMSISNTSHPPGGATALLAAVDPNVARLGWYLLPYVLIGTTLMLGIALAINNIQRQFPVFWWTPKDTGGRLWPVSEATEPDLEALEEQKVVHGRSTIPMRSDGTAGSDSSTASLK